ncbi:hypothetical protein EDD21DRAFT_366681 [Dissophora ornata]|nr:hypothetical protein BGZ58_010317 [Dissophora ornata]KAI8604287.1 hypothetical protein EDD21DRAFT_366681 [Dissophora ornata]
MPVSVDDPFLLASFSSTTHNQQQHQAVSCTPEGRHSVSEKEGEEDSSLLVVAIQGAGVQLFNTADQKCVLSYSTPPGYSFTGSAQTLYKSAHLRNVYAVIAKGTDVTAKEESKVVWMWKDESTSSSLVSVAEADSAMHEDVIKPSSARKTVHKFDRRIHQLFVSPLLPSHVVLTNSDGSISLVTEDLKRVVNTSELQISHSTKPSKKEKKGAVAQDGATAMIWSTTYSTSGSWIPSSALARNTLIIMTVVVSDAGKTIATLSYVNEEQRGFSTFGQVEIEAATGSSGFAFDVKSGQLSFMSAAGQLKIYNFEVSQGDHIITATETLTLPLPGYAVATPTTSTKPTKKGSKTVSEIDSKVQRVDTIALGDSYLAVAGIHQIDGKAEQTLTIWDIRYGTLQAKHVVPGSFSAANTTCQLALLPESVLVMTISTLHNTTIKSDIFLCHFYAEPMSLLGAMGRMKDTAPFLGQKGSTLAQDAYTLTTTALLTPSDISGVVKAKDLSANSADLKKQLEAAQVAEKETLDSLISQSKTSTSQEFESVFFQHVERQTAEAVSDLMERYGVDAEEAKAAVAAKQEKDAELQKQKQKQQRKTDTTQDMDLDVEPVNAEKTETKKEKKKAKKAAKEAESEKKASKDSKLEKKEPKSEKKAAKKAKAGNKTEPAKDVEDGSSSESSSDDDDDEADDEEVVVLSSDDEREEEKEEEPEYEVDEEQERAQMEAYLNAVDEWRKTEAEAIKSYRQQQRLLRAGRKQPPLPELSHHFLSTVVGRCFTRLPNGQPDMSFWPAKVIEYLIENQLVGNSNPGAGQAGVALELMEREQWPLLELALKKLYDIPELDMITMLKQVIGLNKNKASVASSSSTTEAGSSTSLSPVPDVPHFLNLIMAAPRNEIFMQQAIKKLSIEELSIILEILKGWIGIWDERGGIGHQNQQPDKKQLPGGLPGYGLMIDFTTLIMDVHFPSLILSPQLHPVLKAIQSSIQREREISDQLEQALRGPLGLFDRKYREMMRRKKEATVSGFAASGNVGIVSAAGGVVADKRRRRKWEGGEGIPDYAVEIIHL